MRGVRDEGAMKESATVGRFRKRTLRGGGPRRRRAVLSSPPQGRRQLPVSLAFTKFLIKRAATLAIMIFVAIYLTVIIANYAGWWDNVQRDYLQRQVYLELLRDPDFLELSPADRDQVLQDRLAATYEAAGFNENLFVKSLRDAWEVMTLDLGNAMRMRTATNSFLVGDVIVERLPRTVMLFTTGTVIAAALGVSLGLRMARNALTFSDRLFTAVSVVTGAAPAWIWGIFLILFLGVLFPIFPMGGMVGVPAKRNPLEYAFDMLYHMVLPVTAIVIATFGPWAYAVRNLSFQTVSEDYVEAARARGLPTRRVMRRYVLRAASPAVVTSLTIALVTSLTGSIILETWFNWPGLGRLLWDALAPQSQVPIVDVPVVVGIIAVYAYLIAVAVFVLDLIYGLLDPRVRAAK